MQLARIGRGRSRRNHGKTIDRQVAQVPQLQRNGAIIAGRRAGDGTVALDAAFGRFDDFDPQRATVES